MTDTSENTPGLTPEDYKRRKDEILKTPHTTNPAFIYGYECGFEYATLHERARAQERVNGYIAKNKKFGYPKTLFL